MMEESKETITKLPPIPTTHMKLDPTNRLDTDYAVPKTRNLISHENLPSKKQNLLYKKSSGECEETADWDENIEERSGDESSNSDEKPIVHKSKTK